MNKRLTGQDGEPGRQSKEAHWDCRKDRWQRRQNQQDYIWRQAKTQILHLSSWYSFTYSTSHLHPFLQSLIWILYIPWSKLETDLKLSDLFFCLSGALSFSEQKLEKFPPELTKVSLSKKSLSKKTCQKKSKLSRCVICSNFQVVGNLRNLDLSGNRIKLLPENIGAFKMLKTLTMSKNQLDSIPQVSFDPDSKFLSWIEFSFVPIFKLKLILVLFPFFLKN